MANTLKVGIVGCGAIGSETAKAIDAGLSEKAELVGLCDIDRNASKKLKTELKNEVNIYELDELCKHSDLVVEAACAEMVPLLLKLAVQNYCDVLIVSVGGLIDHEPAIAELKESGKHLYIPSGAVGGLDTLKAGMASKVYSVEIITRKPVKGLYGAPYIIDKGIDLDSISGQQVIFEGTAREAIKVFPKNVNVAVTVSLAGLGPDRTKIRIITSPDFDRNSHEVVVEGDFGRLSCKTENVPFPSNPKTSYLAALSCIATLKKVLEGIEIGT